MRVPRAGSRTGDLHWLELTRPTTSTLLSLFRPAQTRVEVSHNPSAAYRFPWEVILAICEEADEATLVQLCLASFGLLGFAGPLLYRQVAITTAKRLHGFFIEVSPSLVFHSPPLLMPCGVSADGC